MEAPLYPDRPIDPSASNNPHPACWVGPRHLAGDDGRLYDVVADALTGLGWTSLTIVRGLREPDEADEDRQVLRSTVLHISPDTLRWAQWTLSDEPFALGELPIAWQVSARTDTDTPLAQWSAYFTPDVPGEAIVDFLVALDVRDRPATPLGTPEQVLRAATANGWHGDVDQPLRAMDPWFVTHISHGEVPALIQDGDPRSLTAGPDDTGRSGWQAWAEPVLGTPYLWASSFSASVPHDLVATFAHALSSPAPVLRRTLPPSTREQLLRAPAD